MMYYIAFHRTLNLKDAQFLAENVPIDFMLVQLSLFGVMSLFTDCREVLELHDKFLSLIDEKQLQAEIDSFIETVQTLMTFLYIQIVSIESAGEFNW
jgi:hypothetical protein